MRAPIDLRARLGYTGAVLAGILLAPGCGSVPQRTPVPEELVSAAEIPGIPRARFWGDEPPPWAESWFTLSAEELRQQFGGIMGREHDYLAISGGGQNGAFGAGLLCGWTAAGTRPEFTIVTGISTGALIAPFAFLGPAHDGILETMYTQYSTEDLIEKRSLLTAIHSDAFAGTEPLAKLIAQFVDDRVMQAIAAEYRKGRQLFIGTTNLDASRPVIWNVGRIADSGQPHALHLIHQIMLASASIPGAFPPVLIDVEVGDGKRYDEIHVDGGVASQVFLYPIGLDWRRIEELLEVAGHPKVYILRNAKLDPEWEAVDPPGLTAILGRSLASLIRTQGIGDMFRIFLGTRRDGLDFSLAVIPQDFDEEYQEEFDIAYMTKLFQRGFDSARNGYTWLTSPPGLEEDVDRRP